MTRTLLGLFLLVLLFRPVGAEEDVYDPVAKEDLALIERVAAGWPPEGSLAALETAMRLASPEETRDLGFGITWQRYEVYAYSLSLWIDVVARDSEVAGVRLYAMDAEPPMVKALQKAFGAGVLDADDAWSARHECPKPMKRVRQAAWTALGKPRARDLPEPIRKAVERLTDPLAELTFGTACYEDGAPPEGRAVADTLHAYASFEVLLRVLAGPNPEGRVYAAEAMLMLEQEGRVLGAMRRGLLDRVRWLEVPIRTCDGCMVSDQQASSLLTGERIADHYLCRVVDRILHRDTPVDRALLTVTWRGSYTHKVHPQPGGPRIFVVPPPHGEVPEAIVEALRRAVADGVGVMSVAGVPTFVVLEGNAADGVPPAVQALLDHVRSR